MKKTFEKKPAEMYTISIDYTNSLPPGATSLASCVATAEDESGHDITDDVIYGLTGVNGLYASTRVMGGTAGQRCHLKFVVTCNDGSILQDDILMKIYNEV